MVHIHSRNCSRRHKLPFHSRACQLNDDRHKGAQALGPKSSQPTILWQSATLTPQSNEMGRKVASASNVTKIFGSPTLGRDGINIGGNVLTKDLHATRLLEEESYQHKFISLRYCALFRSLAHQVTQNIY